jgi:hypothetical protein
MVTQQPEVDGASRPSGLDMTMESRTPLPDRQPEPPLRVFISYKEKDLAATVDIKQKLLKIGGASIKVFVSGDEPAGIQWRENVLRELREAHILIFLYTDPESRWDWCLYETGYFDARQTPEELNRRLYVLHGRGDPPSGPFLGLNTVPIDPLERRNDTELTCFLKTLFEHSTSPAVNPNWNAGGCEDLVTAFAAPFRRREAVAPPLEYIRKLTFRLAKGPATEAALNAGQIPADALVSGNQNSFELFGFGTAAPRSWKLLEESWHRKIPTPPEGSTSPDPAKLWVENVAQKMLAAIRGEDFDDGLPLFFSHFAKTRAQALFRPSLARLAVYSDAYEFDVVFVDVPPEFVSASEGPLTTVGSLLRLAHMFRFGWIEPTARDAVNRPPAEIGEIARDMWRRLNSITAESFNQGIRTEQAVLLAFEEGSALQTEVKQSMEVWESTVAPQLDKSLKEKDTGGILDALKAASAVNWRFHRACAQRYWDIVAEHSRKASGPLEPV